MKNMKKVLAIVFSSTMLVGVSTLGITQETAMAEIERPSYQQASSTQQASEGLEYQLSEDGTFYIVTGIGTCVDTELVIPDTYEGLPVTDINFYAFDSCTSLTSVTIPNSVTNIGYEAFAGCGSLTNIEVDENNANYSSLDGNLYDKAKTELIRYANGKTATSFTIPNSVTSIGEWAFSNCSNLTSVAIGGNVTSIGEWAFSNCSNLTSVAIGGNVTSIGEWAFSNCSNLTSVTIGDSVTNINFHAFDSCSNLTSVTIGSSVTSIGDYAFSNCSNLTSVTIGDSVTSIGEATFYYCYSLTSVIIPDSVTSIGEATFYHCDSLTSITFKGTRAQWEAVEKGEDWNYKVPAEVVCLDDVIDDDNNDDNNNNNNNTNNGCFGTAGLSTCLALMGLSVTMFIKKKDEE